MKPSVLISKYVNGINPFPNEDVRCYHSRKGYMTKELFFTIMKGVFVKHIEAQRSYYGLEGRRAALVVDGHISRFTVRVVDLFMKHNIDLIILPSHSSHVTQPLDLGLNATIKRVFRNALFYVRHLFPLKQSKGVGRPAKHNKVQGVSNAVFEKNMKAQNAELLRGRLESTEETRTRVGKAKYSRAKIVAAVMEAVASLKPNEIKNAWNSAHLYPFYGYPNYTKEQEESLLRQIPKAERDFLLSRADKQPPFQLQHIYL